MSRIGNAPVPVPGGVTVSQTASTISAKGPKGELSMPIPDFVSYEIGDGTVVVKRANDSKPARARHGLGRALLNNMVVGVSDGFEKKLSLVGVGYRAQSQGKTLNLALGYSHPIEYQAPEGITIEVPSQTEIVVRGSDKQKVGQAAAEIRRFRPPEPYKGKGVRYSDERVQLKEAKKK